MSWFGLLCILKILNSQHKENLGLLEITLQQTYAILSLLFIAVFPLVWEKGIRPQIWPILDRSGLVESFRRRNLILSQLYHRHLIITVILIGIGVIFGILSILQ